MLILIAESKTMAPCNGVVRHEDYIANRPELESVADEVMESLRTMTAEELADETKFSIPMAGRLLRMVYDFPHKSAGSPAIEAFTGVVFKAFDYASLDGPERGRACGSIRIISSLYGWLRPDDIVKPYRFDFSTPLAPEGRTFMAYWRDEVTECLVRTLRSTGEGNVLNLLPGDAARCINWKLVEPYAKVWKADFREIRPGGVYRTPNAGRLKTLRGQLLRQIVREGVESLEALMELSSDAYFCEGCDPDSPGSILFTAASV